MFFQISKLGKVQLYPSSIEMYGAQCWPLRNTDEYRLRIFQMKMLSRLNGSMGGVLEKKIQCGIKGGVLTTI